MGLNPKFVSSDVNLFLLPSMDGKDNRKGDGMVYHLYIVNPFLLFTTINACSLFCTLETYIANTVG